MGMKKTGKFALTLALGLGVASASAPAADGSPGASEKPTAQAASQDDAARLQKGADEAVPQEPIARRSERSSVGQDLKTEIEKFRAAREAFLRGQAALRKRLRTSTGEDRADLREQLKVAREEFLQLQKELREQIRNQLHDLREKLQDERDEQLGEANPVGGRTRGKTRN